MKQKRVHKFVGRRARTACGIDGKRRSIHSLQITATRGDEFDCKNCLRKSAR